MAQCRGTGHRFFGKRSRDALWSLLPDDQNAATKSFLQWLGGKVFSTISLPSVRLVVGVVQSDVSA